jgi:hypothetical protein
MVSHFPATILPINLNYRRKHSKSRVIGGAICEDFLGMIDRGNHLPLNENQQTNKFLKKFIAKAQGLY